MRTLRAWNMEYFSVMDALIDVFIIPGFQTHISGQVRCEDLDFLVELSHAGQDSDLMNRDGSVQS